MKFIRRRLFGAFPSAIIFRRCLNISMADDVFDRRDIDAIFEEIADGSTPQIVGQE